LQISGRSTPTFGTRTLDLLHVASAVFLQSEKFYTFDKKQAELARSEGLVVRGVSLRIDETGIVAEVTVCERMRHNQSFGAVKIDRPLPESCQPA
jgi:hypothetical protein